MWFAQHITAVNIITVYTENGLQIALAKLKLTLFYTNLMEKVRNKNMVKYTFSKYVQKYTEKHLDMISFLGAVYILHEASSHRHDEIYDNVANDTVTMKCKCDEPTPVIGDVNPSAGMMGDFIYIDDVDARKSNDDI